jgi:LCP family protein required for cell wall assembly
VAAKRRNHWRALAARVAIALVGSSLITGVAMATSHRVADDALHGSNSIDFGSDVLADKALDDEPAEPTNFLIVGSDSREDLGAGSEDAFGDLGGQRSDTIMVAHVDPKTKTAVLVSFPRDLIVDIAGMGEEKINSAFNSDRGGSPELLILTLKQNFGIDISHYLEVDFSGFADIVNAIGSVDIYFPAPARDRYTNLEVQYYGCGHLDGATALAYVRSRHYQYFDFAEDRWRTDGTSDFGRIRRQQYFIRSLMQQALDRTARQPYKAFDLIDQVSNMITIDKGLNIDDVKKLMFAFIKSDPGAVEMYTVPVQSGNGGLILREEEAQPLLAKLNLRPLEVGVIDYSKYTVDVLNANAEAGAAQIAMGEIAALGFSRGRVGDTESVSRTELRYSSDEGRAAAEFVKLFLGGVGVPVEVARTGGGADVELVLGPDFVAVRDPGVTPTTDAPETTGVQSTGPETTATTIPANPGHEPTDDPNAPTGDQRVGCSGAD